MPNRVIKDSIWSSPTLAKLPLDAQLHWPRLLLMADDWGCFNADADVILGMVYPKMKGMTTRKIDELLSLYVDAGLVFLWADTERRWGHFTSWNGHQYCNATNLDDGGKQQRHRRRTPEPPENELSTYLLGHYQIKQVVSGKLEQSRAACNNSIIPNPNPNPNPNPKKIYGEFQNVKLEDQELEKLETRFGTEYARRQIESLSRYIASNSKGKKYIDHYATLLQWAARDGKNGEPLPSPSTPSTLSDHGRYMQKLITRQLAEQATREASKPSTSEEGGCA